MSAKKTFLRMAVAGLLALGSQSGSADVLNVEFKFTPFTGNTKEDHVDSVPGKAKVFVNNIPVVEQEIEKRELPVLFDAREISPSVWVPVASLGPVLRKGKNSIRIEFEPSAGSPYNAQFSWASVMDQSTETGEAGRFQATNQSGEGKEEKQGTGKIVFTREFTADFAADQPWHHYPAVAALTEDDKQNLGKLLKVRAEAFKPPFAGIYQMLDGKPGVDVAGVRKAKCLDKAYAAGVRIAPPAQLDFATTGNPEVVVQCQDGPLFEPDRTAFERIKGDEMQMCAGMALSLAYPPKLIVVRKPDGSWEVVN